MCRTYLHLVLVLVAVAPVCVLRASDRAPTSTPSAAAEASYLSNSRDAVPFSNSAAPESILQRLQASEARIERLESVLDAADGDGSRVASHTANAWDTRQEAALTEPAAECPECLSSSREPGWSMPDFYVDYDKGFVLRPFDEEQHPFELQINGRMQFRHSGFKRDRDTFSNRGDADRGGPLQVFSRNDFEIERGRLEFRGFVYDPKLEYYINFDFDTDDNHQAIAHDFWFNYRFHKAFNLHAGKGKVPGSRDWLESSTLLRFTDRSLATTFFRPDRSQGVWATGELADDLHYHAMIANGFTTTDLLFSDLDTQFAYSGSMWWDVIGDYGRGYTDLEWHEQPALRLGQSFTYAYQKGVTGIGLPRSEQNFIRLSDGTRIVTPGALAPGVTVVSGKLYLYAIDVAAKCSGFSFNAEVFMRWLNDFGTTGGPIPYSELYSDGFYADLGYMLIEKKLELIGRVSQVDGLFGDHWEYATGVNWFVSGSHKNKITLDLAVLDGSPAQSSSPNYRIGQDGILTRLQWQIAF